MNDEVLNKANPPRRGVIETVIESLFTGYKDQFVALLRKEISDIARAEAERVIGVVRGSDVDRYRSIMLASHTIALQESAEFAIKQMPKARTFSHPHDTLRHALSLAPTGGLALEFGVYTGSTLRIIAEGRKGQKVFGFDSFEGLPDDWRSGIPKGTFAINELPQVPGAELVVGWFDNTLPDFLKKHDGPVDFLHVDCDIYSSTKTVFDLVGPRLRPGSIVLFDELFNYPSWQQHEVPRAHRPEVRVRVLHDEQRAGGGAHRLMHMFERRGEPGARAIERQRPSRRRARLPTGPRAPGWRVPPAPA